MGAASIKIDMKRAMTADGVTVKEGEWISVDGSTGEAFVGQIPTVAPRFEEQTDLITLLQWADEIAAEPGSRQPGKITHPPAACRSGPMQTTRRTHAAPATSAPRASA